MIAGKDAPSHFCIVFVSNQQRLIKNAKNSRQMMMMLINTR